MLPKPAQTLNTNIFPQHVPMAILDRHNHFDQLTGSHMIYVSCHQCLNEYKQRSIVHLRQNKVNEMNHKSKTKQFSNHSSADFNLINIIHY
jgi:hypothetical protein